MIVIYVPCLHLFKCIHRHLLFDLDQHFFVFDGNPLVDHGKQGMEVFLGIFQVERLGTDPCQVIADVGDSIVQSDLAKFTFNQFHRFQEKLLEHFFDPVPCIISSLGKTDHFSTFFRITEKDIVIINHRPGTPGFVFIKPFGFAVVSVIDDV